jgi:hypothetical protein
VSLKVSTSWRVDDRVIARAKAKLRERGERSKAHDVNVGISQADGAKTIIKYTGEEGSASLAYVAAAHEFGAGVPARSWFRSWYDQNLNRNKQQMAEAMRAEQRGQKGAVELIAIQWAGELRAWVSTGRAGLAPLAESTRRQRSRAGLAEEPPLFAIGQIVAAIKAEVDGKNVTP